MTFPIDNRDAWTRAKERYLEDLTPAERLLYTNATPETLLYDASAAEKLHGASSISRGRLKRCLETLIGIVEPYGEALDVYTSAAPLVMGPLWGSIRVILHIAMEFSSYFDKLVEMFTRIGNVLPRFRTYENLFPNHEPLIQALSRVYIDVIEFCSKAKQLFRRGRFASKATARVTLFALWQPFDHKYGQLINAFQEHRRNIEREVKTASMIEDKDTKALIVANKVQIETRNRDRQRVRFMSLLKTADYEAKYRKLTRLRHPGSGDWLLQHHTYRAWRDQESCQTLPMYGIPGCGKSVLTSKVIEDIRNHLESPDPDIIHYYCDYSDQRTLQLDHVLGSVIKQLLVKRQLPEDIESQVLKTYADENELPEEELRNLLHIVARSCSKIYIVIDGLDECDHQIWRSILNVFEDLRALQNLAVKILIPCIEEGMIFHHLSSYTGLQISAAASAADIKAYIIGSVRSKIESRELRIRDPALETEIVSELVSKAKGMFLWAYFQLNEICDTHSDAEVRETLKDLPEDLSATYQRLLSKICRSSKKMLVAQKVFNWVTCAKRPLHVDELKEAAAFSPDDTAWDRDEILDEEPMLESCRGLIVRDEEDQIVRLAHHTVRQHLTTSRTDAQDNRFLIDIADAEVSAGRLCVAYLLFSDFEIQMTKREPKFLPTGVFAPGGPLQLPTSLGIDKTLVDLPYRFRKRTPGIGSPNFDHTTYIHSKFGAKGLVPTSLKDKYRFLSYAIEYWEPHTRWYPIANGGFRRPLRHLVLNKDLAFEFRPWGPNQHSGPKFGCTTCPEDFEGSVFSEKSRELPLTSLIHYALEVGNSTLMMIVPLLAKYIDHEGENILAIACYSGRAQVVKTILESGNICEISEKMIRTSVELGHVELLQYLLQYEDYSIQMHGSKALGLAARNGNLAIIEMLFETLYDVRIDFNAKLPQQELSMRESLLHERSALDIAASSGDSSAVRSLLDKGVKLTERALLRASQEGHILVVETLLDYGAFPNTRNSWGCSPLHAAAIRGNESIVRLLLEYGASPNQTLSFEEQIEEGFEILRYRREDIYNTFHLAAAHGHVPVLEVLKSEFTSVDDPLTEMGYTALQLTARSGHSPAVSWLLENGARIHIKKCLGSAMKDGHVEVVCYLLDFANTSDFISTLQSLPDDSDLEANHAIWTLLVQRLCNDREIPYSQRRIWLVEVFDKAFARGDVVASDLIQREIESYGDVVASDLIQREIESYEDVVAPSLIQREIDRIYEGPDLWNPSIADHSAIQSL